MPANEMLKVIRENQITIDKNSQVSTKIQVDFPSCYVPKLAILI
jgi:type III secretory pathway lipoprotein EscJ